MSTSGSYVSIKEPESYDLSQAPLRRGFYPTVHFQSFSAFDGSSKAYSVALCPDPNKIGRPQWRIYNHNTQPVIDAVASDGTRQRRDNIPACPNGFTDHISYQLVEGHGGTTAAPESEDINPTSLDNGAILDIYAYQRFDRTYYLKAVESTPATNADFWWPSEPQ